MNLKQKHNRDLWNLAFGILFVGLITAQMLSVWQYGPKIELGLTDFILLSLAIFRLTRLFVYDGITQFIRDMFLDATIKKTQIIRTKKDSGPARPLSDILSCPWCFSMWGGSIFLWMYLMCPTTMMYVALLLSLSAVATVLQLSTNLLGWKAEHQKMIVEREQ